ncbi:CENP-B homolog protein 2-like [Solanum dulcamara]|uniref:CENP-B homolog protein 2-like n=1 Tax=Solanum dulcamara TaxID=45834 RepID=UPI002485CF36|nr:CENP-B homolog protein 2-like [Solanum dulcamara]
MSGEIIQGKAKDLFLKMYGETNLEFSFSSGWLERFKSRYIIKSYRRFGESGSVIMKNIENELSNIRSKLDQFELKDIYNMDETGLFYRLEADHSLATKQLEGRKKDKERITLAFCCNDEGIQEVGELDEGTQELNDVISNLAYRNVMDVEHLLNYPNENDTVMELPTEEKIIQSVMNNDDENDPE